MMLLFIFAAYNGMVFDSVRIWKGIVAAHAADEQTIADKDVAVDKAGEATESSKITMKTLAITNVRLTGVTPVDCWKTDNCCAVIEQANDGNRLSGAGSCAAQYAAPGYVHEYPASCARYPALTNDTETGSGHRGWPAPGLW